MKNLIHNSYIGNNNNKNETEILKLEKFISKNLKQEIMSTLITLTKKRNNNELAKSFSTSSFVINNINISHTNSFYTNMIHNSLVNISNQIVQMQNYIKLNQSNRIREMISNKAKGKRNFILKNSLRLNNSFKQINHKIDEYYIGNHSSRETIDQLYKREISKRKQKKKFASSSTQTPFMESKSKFQMEINCKRRNIPEKELIHIHKVKLNPIVSRMIPNNI